MRALRSLSLAALLAPSTALAGGFAIDEQDAASLGRAGTAGARTGAMSMAYNPAGLVAPTTADVRIGLTPIVPSAAATDTAGVTHQTPSSLFLLPHLHASWRIGELAFGASFHAPFGLGAAWADDFPDRFTVKTSSIQTLAFLGGVAWRPIPELSLGATVGALRTTFATTRAIDFVSQEGEVALSASGTGLGANFGIRFEPTDRIAVGLSGSIPTATSLAGTARFSNIPDSFAQLTPDQDITSKLTLPSKTRLGLSVGVTEALRIDADLQVTFWKSVPEIPIDFSNPATPDAASRKDWKNTATVRLGGEYELEKVGTLRLGGLFDQAAAPLNTLAADSPSCHRLGVSLGYGRDIARGVRVDAAYAYLKLLERESSREEFIAVFNGQAHAFSVTLSWHFDDASDPLPRRVRDQGSKIGTKDEEETEGSLLKRREEK